MPAQGKAEGVERPRAGCDPEALERYRGPLRAYAYARVRDWEAAEDLAQEAMIRAFQSPETPHDPAEIPHYLRRILKNLCIDFARRTRRTAPLRLISERDDGAGQVPTALSQVIARAAEEEFLEQDGRQRILEAIEELPRRLREVVVMRCLDGLSYAEMGRFLGIKPQTINWRLHKARQLLAEELGMHTEDPARGPLTCRQCRRLLSPFIDGELEFPEMRRVHRHLHECERCTEELERVCEQLPQVDLAVAWAAGGAGIELGHYPRAWNRAWELMAGRIDEIAEDDEQALRAVRTFAVPGLIPEQLDLLLRLAQACVEANPDSPKALEALARVHIRRHDYEAAQVSFERHIQLAARLADPAQAQRWQAAGLSGLAWVWDHLARRAEEAGDREAARAAAERAVEYGRQVIDSDPDSDPWRQGWIVEWLAWLGREQEALREIQRYVGAMEAAGKGPVCMKIGNALYLLGRREEALQYWQRGAAGVPLKAGRLRSLGSQHELLGQPEEAAFWRARAEALRRTSGPQTQSWLPPA